MEIIRRGTFKEGYPKIKECPDCATVFRHEYLDEYGAPKQKRHYMLHVVSETYGRYVACPLCGTPIKAGEDFIRNNETGTITIIADGPLTESTEGQENSDSFPANGFAGHGKAKDWTIKLSSHPNEGATKPEH